MGIHVRFWGCELVFEDIMKKEEYLHLLQHNLVKCAEKLGIAGVYLQGVEWDRTPSRRKIK